MKFSLPLIPSILNSDQMIELLTIFLIIFLFIYIIKNLTILLMIESNNWTILLSSHQTLLCLHSLSQIQVLKTMSLLQSCIFMFTISLWSKHFIMPSIPQALKQNFLPWDMALINLHIYKTSPKLLSSLTQSIQQKRYLILYLTRFKNKWPLFLMAFENSFLGIMKTWLNSGNAQVNTSGPFTIVSTLKQSLSISLLLWQPLVTKTNSITSE